jgi:hypothetical protein
LSSSISIFMRETVDALPGLVNQAKVLDR